MMDILDQIVKAVVAHESALRAQAKKMNVESLRSNVKDGDESAEVRIAKVRLKLLTCVIRTDSYPGCYHQCDAVVVYLDPLCSCRCYWMLWRPVSGDSTGVADTVILR